MQLARGGLPRPRMTLASFVLVSDLNGSRLDLGGRFRAATGKKRKTILYQNPTTHGYPHTRYCLLRASSTGRNNRRAFLFSLYSISLRRVAVGCWCSCSLPKIGKIKNRLAVWPSRNEAAQGKFQMIVGVCWRRAHACAVDYRTSSDRYMYGKAKRHRRKFPCPHSVRRDAALLRSLL